MHRSVKKAFQLLKNKCSLHTKLQNKFQEDQRSIKFKLENKKKINIFNNIQIEKGFLNKKRKLQRSVVHFTA